MWAKPPAATELIASVPEPPKTDHPVAAPLSRSPLPTMFGVVMQIPALQKAPGTHAASVAQLVPHAPAGARKSIAAHGGVRHAGAGPVADARRDDGGVVGVARGVRVAPPGRRRGHGRPPNRCRRRWCRTCPTSWTTHSSRGWVPLSAGTHLPLVVPYARHARARARLVAAHPLGGAIRAHAVPRRWRHVAPSAPGCRPRNRYRRPHCRCRRSLRAARSASARTTSDTGATPGNRPHRRHRRRRCRSRPSPPPPVLLALPPSPSPATPEPPPPMLPAPPPPGAGTCHPAPSHHAP